MKALRAGLCQENSPLCHISCCVLHLSTLAWPDWNGQSFSSLWSGRSPTMCCVPALQKTQHVLKMQGKCSKCNVNVRRDFHSHCHTSGESSFSQSLHMTPPWSPRPNHGSWRRIIPYQNDSRRRIHEGTAAVTRMHARYPNPYLQKLFVKDISSADRRVQHPPLSSPHGTPYPSTLPKKRAPFQKSGKSMPTCAEAAAPPAAGWPKAMAKHSKAPLTISTLARSSRRMPHRTGKPELPTAIWACASPAPPAMPVAASDFAAVPGGDEL